MDSLAHRVSEAADAAISHPAAFILFNLAVAAGFAVGGTEATNVAISILTADVLFITSISARRARLKLEREAEELARVHPEIDEEQIEREIEERVRGRDASSPA